MQGFKKYMKDPEVVQAKQMPIYFKTPKGTGQPGDYLVVNVKGEQFAVNKDFFESNYQEVQE